MWSRLPLWEVLDLWYKVLQQRGKLGTSPPPVWIGLLVGWFHMNRGHHYLGYIVQTRSVKRKWSGWNGHILIAARQDQIQKLTSKGAGLV